MRLPSPPGIAIISQHLSIAPGTQPRKPHEYVLFSTRHIKAIHNSATHGEVLTNSDDVSGAIRYQIQCLPNGGVDIFQCS